MSKINLTDIQQNMRAKKERQRAAEKRWRAAKRADGFCTNCFKAKAGGEGGTTRYCPTCAEKRRKLYRDDFYGPYRGETTKQVDEMLALSGKVPKSSVDVSELRRQAVC